MMILVLLLLAGLAGLGGGGMALYLELTRAPTRAEVAAAGEAEIASRWQRLAAGQIFPATIRYLTSAGLHATAVRTGISPRASCRAALDAAVAIVFRRAGCVTVLRATYVDRQGLLAATVGVAVMRNAPAAGRAAPTSPPVRTGVRVARFPGSWAGLFRNAQRGWFMTTGSSGRYVFLVAAGYLDGRPGHADYAAGPESLGSGVLNHVVTVLTTGGKPCARKAVRC